MSPRAFKAVIDIDLIGSFNTLKATLPYLEESAKKYPATGGASKFDPTAQLRNWTKLLESLLESKPTDVFHFQRLQPALAEGLSSSAQRSNTRVRLSWPTAARPKQASIPCPQLWLWNTGKSLPSLERVAMSASRHGSSTMADGLPNILGPSADRTSVRAD